MTAWPPPGGRKGDRFRSATLCAVVETVQRESGGGRTVPCGSIQALWHLPGSAWRSDVRTVRSESGQGSQIHVNYSIDQGLCQGFVREAE